ncbi:MAG: DEAD/DEAH box helicase [Cyclobacteriaceae bacterium]|nr:DEAD/DEAH box helicase [Cyclobacteriaceae bacterium]
MNPITDTNKLNLIKSLFKGREDVFAIRKEKNGKSMYMPACQFDPFIWRMHQMKGGKWSNFMEKTYLPLTDQPLLMHLNGQQFIGIYPLLQDNTSWFIVADFDKEGWSDESLSLIKVCRSYEIPAYLERSQSGKGGHVWIFFEKPYPAVNSRKILNRLLEDAGLVSALNKNASFDRLFPNQDKHAGKGMGNLIALPFYKPAMEKGNSCFVDDQCQPFPDQWDFLLNMKRISAEELDEIYHSLFLDNPAANKTINSEKLQICLSNVVTLNRSGIIPELFDFLKEQLNITNADYFIRKKSGKNTYGHTPFTNLCEETENEIIIPRGFVGNLLRFCKGQNIDYDFKDQRKKHKPVTFHTTFELREHQKSAIEAASRKQFGVISAPPGSGKTIIGLKIISDRKQPALIIVHRKQLMDQWLERIEAFMGIPKQEVGKIGQGKSSVKNITIATVQSLGKWIEKQKDDEQMRHLFGTLMVDECHHIPAATYRNVISKLAPYYQYGLTATPFRKGNDGKMIFIHLGEIIAHILPQNIALHKQAKVIIRETQLEVPFNPKTDPFETLAKILIHDASRNKLILGDVAAEINSGKRVVIITERKEHILTLNQFLKQHFEVISLSGDDTESTRKEKWKLIKNGSYQALITTGQFFGEGIDLQNASCLFLVFPFAFKGKLIQYIGRVQRSELTPVIYDYHDIRVDYLNRLFLKRNTYYRLMERQSRLFDDDVEPVAAFPRFLIIEKKLKIPLDELDFRFGSVAFEYLIKETALKLEFEIENEEIRPEFDVLKPYFARILKRKQVNIEIYAELENGILISQSASSEDLEKINHEIIDGVKFRFLQQELITGRRTQTKSGSLRDIHTLQDGKPPLYGSEDALLEDLLKNERVKHYRQLRYLAGRHQSDILKLRFVLQPFSFVFLIAGTRQYHLVLETLDTEEATYIWHIDKSPESVMEQLPDIEDALTLIRNEGRQSYLETQPTKFSRIFHDYSDGRKGFIIWKHQLEERLF